MILEQTTTAWYFKDLHFYKVGSQLTSRKVTKQRIASFMSRLLWSQKTFAVVQYELLWQRKFFFSCQLLQNDYHNPKISPSGQICKPTKTTRNKVWSNLMRFAQKQKHNPQIETCNGWRQPLNQEDTFAVLLITSPSEMITEQRVNEAHCRSASRRVSFSLHHSVLRRAVQY